MRALPLALLVVLLAGCAAPGAQVSPPDGDDARAPADAWKAGLSEERFPGLVTTLVKIKAHDGTQLTLSLHLPEGLPADAKVPTLLEITPYQAGAETQTPLQGPARPRDAWADYVKRGAAYVAADARGTAGSEGCLDFGGAKDRADALAFIEWIRAQPWSDGVVVTDGVSHPGMGSLVAHTGAAPVLAAALSHAPVVSYYRDEWYQGAKFEDQNNGLGYQLVDLQAPAWTDPDVVKAQAAPCAGQTLLQYEQPDGRFGPMWAERDLARFVPEERVPVLLTQGFVDQNVHPDHVQAYWDALPADYPKHVVWGWWYHGWPNMTDHPAETFAQMRHRWLDATLFGIDNGLWKEPRVLVEDSRGVWHEGNDWPLESSETVVLAPTVEGGLPREPGAEGQVAYEDRLRPTRGEWEGASAVFRTDPLAEARLVLGAPVVELVASSNVDATKWVVYLLNEAPDGSWERVSHGYADSRTWNGADKWEPMQPGKAYTWMVQLMPTAVVLDPGHRLVLLVASQDSRQMLPGGEAPRCWDDHGGSARGCYRPSGIDPAETMGRAVNAVHVGPAGTRVTLHWMDPQAQTVG